MCRIKLIITSLLLVSGIPTFLFGVMSCSRIENPEPQKEDAQTDMVFWGGTPTVTKTFLDPEAQIHWETGDMISLFRSSINQQYLFEGENGSTWSQFVKNDDTDSHATFSCNYALYPWTNDASSPTEGTITFTLPHTQMYADRSFAQGANPMVAVSADSNSKELMFKNLCGFLQIRLYGVATVRYIRLSGNNDEVLCGEATITASHDNETLLTMSSGGGKVLTLDCNEEGIALNPTYTPFWLVIPPVYFSKGFTIEVEFITGETFSKSTHKSIAIKRGQAQPMAAITCMDALNGTPIEDGMNAVGLISDAKSGKGISGIPVTDGYTYVVTDENGVYQMKADSKTRNVYLSVPANYKIPLDPETHLPLFYSTTPFNSGAINRNDFVLESQAEEDNFTLVMIGDPQCQNASQVSRWNNETVPSIIDAMDQGQALGRYPNPYGITLGDITYDSTNLWGTMKESMSNLTLSAGGWIPIFQCIGNHDHNSLAPKDDYDAVGAFSEHFGPTDYSFDRGQAHIITIDNIIGTKVVSSSTPNGKSWSYSAGITEEKLRWIESDLALVENKADKLVILCMHIPIQDGGDYKKVLALLKEFKEAHIMAGHTHYTRNTIHTTQICSGGNPIYEHIHGAACGALWICNSNTTGAPNGYSIYEIEGNTVTNWILKATKKDFGYQMRVYDGNQVYTGKKGLKYSWSTANLQLKNAFVAEVFNDDNLYWKVEMWQNGIKVGDFKRLADGTVSNICLTSYFNNELGISRYSSATPSHYWYYVPSSGNPSAEENWEVRAVQTIPTSGRINTYYCTTLTTDYSDF